MRSWGASLGTGGWARATHARVAAHHRPHEDGGEEHASRADGLRVDGRAAVKGAERAHEDDGDRVVEHLRRAAPRLAVISARSRHDLGAHRLAEDHREEVDLDAEGLEDSEDGDGVGGRDERAEGERGEEAERVAEAVDASHVDDAADDEGRGERADKGEEHRGPDVLEERGDVHVEPGLEDDGR